MGDIQKYREIHAMNSDKAIGRYTFYRAMRDIEIACRLSVCPSVTLVDQDHIS